MLLVGLSADVLKDDGADAAVLSLGFLKQRYADELLYDPARDLAAAGADPWELFRLPFVKAAVTHLRAASNQ